MKTSPFRAFHSRTDRRTSLAKAIGLGSSHTGIHHWWAQRVSAIALVPLSLWLLSCLICALTSDFNAAIAWIRTLPGGVGLILFLVMSAYHGILGLQVIYEDYIHSRGIRLSMILATKFAFMTGALAGILCVLKLIFS